MKSTISPEPSLLGFLLDGPRHGYELHKQVSQNLGPIWRLGISQMYAILNDYEARGWIRTRVERHGARPARKVLEITPAGRRAFEVWMAQPARGIRELRVDFFARLYFARAAGRQEMARLLDQQMDASRHELEGLSPEREQRDSMVDEFRSALLEFRREQLTTALKWLEKNRRGFAPIRSVRKQRMK